MPDRTWENVARHLAQRDQERAAIEARMRELAAKYEVPWSEVARSMDAAEG